MLTGLEPEPLLTDAPTALSSHPGSSSSSNPFGFGADDEAGPGPWSVELQTESGQAHSQAVGSTPLLLAH